MYNKNVRYIYIYIYKRKNYETKAFNRINLFNIKNKLFLIAAYHLLM